MKNIKNKKQFLFALICVGAGVVVGVGMYALGAKIVRENISEVSLPSNPYIRKDDNIRSIQSTSTNKYFYPMEPIRFSDVVFTDKNHVLYPGTQRVVDAGYFMGTYVPFNPSKLVYVQYDAKDLGVSFTCPENFVFTSVLGFRLTVSLRPQLYTEHPRVHTIYTNDFGEASQFRIERERIDRLGIESWESYIASFGPSEETVVVDGSAASKYVYPDSSGYGDHVIYFIKRGKYMYTISYENQINLTPEFDKILASIEFTEE